MGALDGGLLITVAIAKFRTCPVGLVGRRRQVPGCPTLCPLGAEEGHPGLTPLLLSQTRRWTRASTSARIGPQLSHPAGRPVVVPILLLQSSTFEIECDSRRQTTTRLAGAPRRFGQVTGPTMTSPGLRVGLPPRTSALRRYFRHRVPTSGRNGCTAATGPPAEVVCRHVRDAL